MSDPSQRPTEEPPVQRVEIAYKQTKLGNAIGVAVLVVMAVMLVAGGFFAYFVFTQLFDM